MKSRLNPIFALVVCVAASSLGSVMAQRNVFKQWVSTRIGQIASLPLADADAALTAVLDSLSQADIERGYEPFVEQCERELGTPASRSHSEQLMLTTLRHAVCQEKMPEMNRLRYKALLDVAERNAIGTPSADLTLVTPDGAEHLLSEYFATPLTILYFNDPDCDACEIVKHRLDTTAIIAEMVQKKALTIVAIYPYDDERLWHAATYPSSMVNTWDKSQAVDMEQTYDVPSMPLLYLIGADGTVLMRNEASLNRVIAALEKVASLGTADAASLVTAIYTP